MDRRRRLRDGEMFHKKSFTYTSDTLCIIRWFRDAFPGNIAVRKFNTISDSHFSKLRIESDGFSMSKEQ